MRRVFAVLFCILLPLTAWAGSEGSLPDQTLLDALKSKAESVDRLACDFTQEKHLALFDDTLVSTGRFAFEKPDKLRWEYLAPFKSGFFLNGEAGREWDEATGASRDFTLDSSPAMAMLARQIMAWTTFDIRWLEEQYEMRVLQKGPVVFQLTPRDEAARQFISHMTVTFTPDGDALERMEIHEADGDFTRVLFAAPQVNAPLPEATFTQVP